LSQDGNRLVVLASKYRFYPLYVTGVAMPGTPSSSLAMPMIPIFRADVYTFIYVYDVSNHAQPILARNLTVSGSYFNSRMIGNYVYVVVSQPAIVYNSNVTLPTIYNGNRSSSVTPSSIYYSTMVYPTYYTYTTFFGVDVLNDSQQPTNMTVLMGGASTMYVSPNNIYITYPVWKTNGQYTSIYRVSVNGPKLEFQAQGNVPGYLIDQYSMDEFNGYFRVATTTVINRTQTNNLYVLDSQLAIAGKLEGLAQGQRLFSSRFMGDKCYLVTFKQVDPFFVIDLSNPLAPKVAGELKIPGYSSFLQPYDENHVIGFGMENETLKLSLFDVSNVNNPTEISTYIVKGNYTSSTALYEPKAILFDLQKQLLVIPVSIYDYAYQSPAPPTTSGGSSSPQGATTIVTPPIIIVKTQYWQGAYVFNVDANTGFSLKGTVTHLNATLLNSQGFIDGGTIYYNYQNNMISRSLYIDNTLYTVSNTEVKLNSLTDLTEIATINLR